MASLDLILHGQALIGSIATNQRILI